MKCPYCINEATDVVETRGNEDLTVTRRRRECGKCGKRFTTYERIEVVPLIVIKKSGLRENFDREKLKKGISKACEKTSVTYQDIEEIVSGVEKELLASESIEVQSKNIGQMVATRLKKKDKVAFIRFASVFKRFVDLEDFEKEVHKLL